MGKIYSGDGWILRVHGDEHPPVHTHLVHPDGKAVIALDGGAVNSGVPIKVLRAARQWVLDHPEEIVAEWAKMNNPRARSV